MITTVSPKPMIAIVLRPRRIPRRLSTTSSWPCVLTLKYAPTITTAIVTPPMRASVERAQPNRFRDVTGASRGEGSSGTSVIFLVEASGGGPGAAPGPPVGAARVLREPGQRVGLEVGEFLLRRREVRLRDDRQLLCVRHDLAGLRELCASDCAERGLLRPVLVVKGDLGAVLERRDLVGCHVPAGAERLAGLSVILERAGGDAGADVHVLDHVDVLTCPTEERLERVVGLTGIVRRVEHVLLGRDEGRARDRRLNPFPDAVGTR